MKLSAGFELKSRRVAFIRLEMDDYISYIFVTIINNIYYINDLLQPEFRKCLGRFLNLNKMKTKLISNHKTIIYSQ